jgi:hypothetical protein
MSKAAKSPGPATTTLPADRQKIVEIGFVPVRAKLIDVAAFLDRIERYGVANDYRCVAMREALKALADGKPERARRILEAFSDPTTEPDAVSTGKAAYGAYRPGNREAK